MFLNNSCPDYAVIDLETTGLTDTDRIVEVGIVLMDNKGMITDSYETLIRPLKPMGASSVHQITDDMVRHAPTFESFYPQLLCLIENRKLVAHNASFEAKALCRELTTSGVDIKVNNFIDTLEVSRAFLKSKVTNHKLNSIASYYNLTLSNPHHALSDAYTTALVLQKFIENPNFHTQFNNVVPVVANDFQDITFNPDLWLPRSKVSSL